MKRAQPLRGVRSGTQGSRAGRSIWPRIAVSSSGNTGFGFPRRAVAHHQQSEPRGRARQPVVHQPLAHVHGHERSPARAVAIARPPVGHRAECAHDRLRRRRHTEPPLPGPFDPQSPVVKALDPGPQNLAAQRVHALPNTMLRLLERRRARLRSKRRAAHSRQPRQRLKNPNRQAREIDGRRQRRLRHWHGTAPEVGVDTASYPASGGPERSRTKTPASRYRDKIQPSNPRLSTNRRPRPTKTTQKLNKPIGYSRHTGLAPITDENGRRRGHAGDRRWLDALG